MDPTVIAFLVGALLVNLLTYGGVTLVYFLDKHRVDPLAGSLEGQPPALVRARSSAEAAPERWAA